MESRRLDLLRGARRRQPEDSARAVARVEEIAVDLRLLAHRLDGGPDGVFRRARVLAWVVVVAVVGNIGKRVGSWRGLAVLLDVARHLASADGTASLEGM